MIVGIDSFRLKKYENGRPDKFREVLTGLALVDELGQGASILSAEGPPAEQWVDTVIL